MEGVLKNILLEGITLVISKMLHEDRHEQFLFRMFRVWIEYM